MKTYRLSDESETEVLGKAIAGLLVGAFAIDLVGDLGAGKTTLTRGILRGLGFDGLVKSPTYTIVEPYHLNDLDFYHLDLYRLNSPLELEAVGYPELLGDNVIVCIEWPLKGKGMLETPDLGISLTHVGDERSALIEYHSAKGKLLVDKLRYP